MGVGAVWCGSCSASGSSNDGGGDDDDVLTLAQFPSNLARVTKQAKTFLMGRKSKQVYTKQVHRRSTSSTQKLDSLLLGAIP